MVDWSGFLIAFFIWIFLYYICFYFYSKKINNILECNYNRLDNIKHIALVSFIFGFFYILFLILMLFTNIHEQIINLIIIFTQPLVFYFLVKNDTKKSPLKSFLIIFLTSFLFNLLLGIILIAFFMIFGKF